MKRNFGKFKAFEIRKTDRNAQSDGVYTGSIDLIKKIEANGFTYGN
jgi:hypothetical protein